MFNFGIQIVVRHCHGGRGLHVYGNKAEMTSQIGSLSIVSADALEVDNPYPVTYLFLGCDAQYVSIRTLLI